MAKPVYYLWRDKDTDEEKLSRRKEMLLNAGFKVFICNNTSDDDNLEEGLLNIIKNHINIKSQ